MKYLHLAALPHGWRLGETRPWWEPPVEGEDVFVVSCRTEEREALLFALQTNLHIAAFLLWFDVFIFIYLDPATIQARQTDTIQRRLAKLKEDGKAFLVPFQFPLSFTVEQHKRVS